ncbi:hypothetical protein PC118_g21880 [Phytophthora cactorum]|uniref:Uncharacterized protein n=1 Tax=Phytophthora cactorum TaxID=29920 RepID=A0A8T1AVY4_9STRA|nr:hypothetical protein PC114_g23870 [Phytophthora cactorum]KAG2891398.1 hypothetical protein PC117_g24252 [Phytophthora cactorum]KAG2961600.1 hypothetical protein PC118_g21880 [Phytophthora cactorum]KAG2987884.1 hypothetical protein PC120_g23513 [Phytophthora cactorum]
MGSPDRMAKLRSSPHLLPRRTGARVAKKHKQPPLPRNDERSDEEYVEAGDGASSDASEHVEATQPSVPPKQAALAIVPSILGKTFESSAAFFAFWEQFEWQNFVVYHTRDCQMAHGKRTNRPDLQVPPHFGYAFRKTIYTALKQCKDMLNESVLAMLDAFGQTNTETKQITSYVADSIGLQVSTPQVRNLMNAQLGHGSAEERLKVVMLEFAADETNKSAVLQANGTKR